MITRKEAREFSLVIGDKYGKPVHRNSDYGR